MWLVCQHRLPMPPASSPPAQLFYSLLPSSARKFGEPFREMLNKNVKTFSRRRNYIVFSYCVYICLEIGSLQDGGRGGGRGRASCKSNKTTAGRFGSSISRHQRHSRAVCATTWASIDATPKVTNVTRKLITIKWATTVTPPKRENHIKLTEVSSSRSWRSTR